MAPAGLCIVSKAIRADFVPPRAIQQAIPVLDELTPLGMICRLESTLAKLEAEQAGQEERQEPAESLLADYETCTREPFEREVDLVERRTQHTQLGEDLAVQQDGEPTKKEQEAVSTFEGSFGVVIQFSGRAGIAEVEEGRNPR